MFINSIFNLKFSTLIGLLVFISLSSCKNSQQSNDQSLSSDNQSIKGKKEVRDSFPEGGLSKQYYLIDGKKEGLMTEFYKSGQKRAEKYFANDYQNGITKVWYENGKLKEIQYYTNDIRVGGDTIFHENGKYSMIVQFNEKGQKNGDMIFFDTLGVKEYHAVYENDVIKIVNGKPAKKYGENK
jgi:antitoxin component YwqK of YwqJK toxin-antitoxin module